MLAFDPEICWNWTGAKSRGYGACYLEKKNRKSVVIRVHRYLYEYLLDKKLNRHELCCHKCNNRSCFNPHHIYIGSDFDNAQDRKRAGTSISEKILFNCKVTLAEKKKKKIKDNLGNNFSSIMEAAKFHNIIRTSISNNLNGWSKSTRNNLKFSYIKE